MAASDEDRQQIASVIEQYRRGFAMMDVEGLKAIWDQDYDNILYVPQGDQRACEWTKRRRISIGREAKHTARPNEKAGH